jgi:hypothetical protein
MSLDRLWYQQGKR